MNNYVRPPPIFTLGAILRVSVLVTLVWIIGDALDGGSQSIVPPLLVAAWLYVIVVLDRWVFQRTGEGSPSTSRGPMELIERRLGANMPGEAARCAGPQDLQAGHSHPGSGLAAYKIVAMEPMPQ